LKNLDYQHDICLARRQFNEAILHRDADKICTFFTNDYFVMTGRGVQSQGLKVQRKRWSESFVTDPILCYRRKTRELRVSKQLGCAEELGRWVGKYSVNQHVIFAAGVYSAKWQLKNDGRWLIQTEVFTTLRSKVTE
jgi:ketosteroid isomerase-like protein